MQGWMKSKVKRERKEVIGQRDKRKDGKEERGKREGKGYRKRREETMEGKRKRREGKYIRGLPVRGRTF